ncbi:hypothetical protein MWU75_19280 [Ornithinimicrobium sp. F0845]|uniref:phosphatase PAP2 family protein n=1 Tax=Ornithinimicrobium sp. F0845 TaxID=2926412 RepID=UPI001FF2393C|nr:phosphatase PAP2 family protein [Ornithinimicrobium sp. F0845]MCK0114286.1 hypothetical protein [Ornithinimicrobium sp. F0845]
MRAVTRGAGARDPVWRLLWVVVGLASWAWLAALAQFWIDTTLGERFDAALASPLIHGLPWSVREALSWLARPVLVVAAGVLAVALVLLALRARRFRAALTAVLVPALSLVVLDRVDDGWAGLGTQSFPSGHAVAGYAVLVSVACVWPSSVRSARDSGPGEALGQPGEAPGRRGAALGRWWAPVLWVLGVVTITVGNVTMHAHLPGDVIGAALLVTGVSGLLLGILAPRPVRGGSVGRRGTMVPP